MGRIAIIIILIGIAIFLFLVCREFWAWYTKRNQQLEKLDAQLANQKTIIELLKEQNTLLKNANSVNDKTNH